MTPTDGPQPHDELTDDELDALLAAGEARLLDYVRKNTDTTTALAALLEIDADVDNAAGPISFEPAYHITAVPLTRLHDAAHIIVQRIRPRPPPTQPSSEPQYTTRLVTRLEVGVGASITPRS
jgi:hypothetical protein